MMSIHKYAAARQARRVSDRSGPVTTQKVSPLAHECALFLAYLDAPRRAPHHTPIRRSGAAAALTQSGPALAQPTPPPPQSVSATVTAARRLTFRRAA